MGKNRNNSSTRKARLQVKAPDKMHFQGETPNIQEIPARTTRSGLKRSCSPSCTEQPLPKQSKTKKQAKGGIKAKASKAKQVAQREKEADSSMPKAIVASAKSLITSIKNGVIGKPKMRKEEATDGGRVSTPRSRKNPVLSVVAPSTSKGGNKTFAEEGELSSEDEIGADRVRLTHSSEDEYGDLSSPSRSECESSYSSSDGSLDSDSNEDESSGEESGVEDTAPVGKDTRRYGSQSEEELDQNDPRVRRLVDRILREERSVEKGNVKNQVDNPDKVSKAKRKSQNGKVFDKGNLKSPSDTTLYAPALQKGVGRGTPLGVGANFISPPNTLNVSEQVSNFVEKLRTESKEVDTPSRRGKDRHNSGSRRDSGGRHHRDDRRSHSKDRHRSRSRSVADEIVLQAERFKATIDPPKGKDSDNAAQTGINSSLEHNINELLQLLKSQNVTEVDNDDDFFHITCHIEGNLRSKIAKGEFVDLEKLLPKTKLQIMTGVENEIEVVRKNGSTYVFPESGQRDQRITNVHRWEQAFRVYSAIYSESNPDRAAEIWQYVHVINTAAQTFAWENVSFYDITFRQLMEKKPHRSWSKIYTQMWNLALTDRVSKPSYGSGYQGSSGYGGSGNTSSGHKRYGDWRDRCCWRYNKGKCQKYNCRFDHRCTTKECGSYSHPTFQCPKKKAKAPFGGGNSQINPTGSKSSENKLN